MPNYLLSIIQPAGGTPPPPEVLDPIMRDVEALRQEMVAAGAWVFSGGLHAPDTATVVRQRDGEILVTDGPYTEGKEYVGGFTIVRAPDLDSALEWGTKLARVLGGLAVEVRPFVWQGDD